MNIDTILTILILFMFVYVPYAIIKNPYSYEEVKKSLEDEEK